jgi:hypothetical protein
MGLLDKLMGREKKRDVRAGLASTQARTVQENADCVHTSLVPKWDSVADMGHEDKATSWTCSACGRDFPPEEGQAMRATEADRLRQRMEAVSEQNETTS